MKAATRRALPSSAFAYPRTRRYPINTVSRARNALARAAQTYKSGCVNCHQPPDLTFRTDHAWLDQVNRTG